MTPRGLSIKVLRMPGRYPAVLSEMPVVHWPDPGEDPYGPDWTPIPYCPCEPCSDLRRSLNKTFWRALLHWLRR